MTLIVGRIFDNDLFIESDTKITDELGIKNYPLLGSLKVVILHPFLCLAFAGRVSFAEEAIKKIFSRKKYTFFELIEILIKANIESIKSSEGNPDKQTQFVLSFIESKAPQIVKIADGKVETGCKSFWLGDIGAFSAFQENYSFFREKGYSEKMSLKFGFKRIIDDGTYDTVGNFQISLSSTNEPCPGEKVFLYSCATETSIGMPQSIEFKKANEWQPVSLGTTPSGAYGISYLTSMSSKLHGVAIHFSFGNFGVLFCPQLSFEGIVIRNVDGLQFAKEIKDRYNIPLQGLVKIDDYSLQFIDTREIENQGKQEDK